VQTHTARRHKRGQRLENMPSQILRRRIDAVKGWCGIEILVIQGVQHGFEIRFQHREIYQQFGIRGQAVAFDHGLHQKIVTVRTFALAPVVSKGMSR